MKGYWICVYEKIDNSEKLNEYAGKAKPAVEKYSGNIELTREITLQEQLWLSFLITIRLSSVMILLNIRKHLIY